MEFYWELLLKDGSSVEIPPGAVAVVKRRWTSGEPIHMRTRSIPATLIKDFQQTDRQYSAQPLLEAASQAFHEAEVSEDGAILTRWVKKIVTADKWNRHYSHHPYKLLKNENGMVLIATRVAIHDINVNNTPYCTEDEIRELESNN